MKPDNEEDNWVSPFFGTHSYGLSPEMETIIVRIWFAIGVIAGFTLRCYL